MSEQSVTLIAQISKVQTLADGGMRYTLDGPEDAVMQSAALMEMKRLGYAVKVTIEAVTQETNAGNSTKVQY